MTFFFMVDSREITIKGLLRHITFRVDQYMSFKTIVDEPKKGIYKQRLLLTLKRSPESEEKEKEKEEVIELQSYKIKGKGDKAKRVYVEYQYGSYVIDIAQKLQDVITGEKRYITEDDWQGFQMDYDEYCRQRQLERERVLDKKD